MKIRLLDSAPAPTPAGGLVDLVEAPLGDAARARLDDASVGMRGDAAWRVRKAAELRDLVALEERAPRLKILELDARTDLLVRLRLAAPVPVADDPAFLGLEGFLDQVDARRPREAKHRVVDGAVVTIHYPASVLTQPLPGIGVAHVAEPGHVWHPNISHDGLGKVCLGGSVVRGTPVREVVLMVYAALTLQAGSFDPVRDLGGVLNGRAVAYWARRPAERPLTRDPILAPVRPWRGEIQ